MIKLTLKADTLLQEIIAGTDKATNTYKSVNKNTNALKELESLGLVQTAPNPNNGLQVFTLATELGVQVANGEVDVEVEGEAKHAEQAQAAPAFQQTTQERRMFQFETGIELPKNTRQAKSRFDGIPFEQMQVGQSFTMPVEPSKRAVPNMNQALINYQKNRGSDMKFTVRYVDGRNDMVRIWRKA